MTPTEINIAIAEACPEIFSIGETYESMWNKAKLRKYVYRKGDEDRHEIDPLNDLNACYEAWLSLNDNQKQRFENELVDLVCATKDKKKKPMYVQACVAINATAPQRCEAFLRVIGKWREPTSDSVTPKAVTNPKTV